MGNLMLAVTFTGTMLVVACAPATEPAQPTPEPDAAVSSDPVPARIVAERGGFVPEGVEYDQTNRRFLTGSLAEGSIFEIHNDVSI